jgi:hypothetical protein
VNDKKDRDVVVIKDHEPPEVNEAAAKKEAIKESDVNFHRSFDTLLGDKLRQFIVIFIQNGDQII